MINIKLIFLFKIYIYKMENYPKPMTKQCMQIIIDQMEHAFYNIKDKNGNAGIGFFCYIKNKSKNIPVLIINNYKIDEEYNNEINIISNNNLKTIKIGEKYRNKEYNISIIEIKENINNDYYFLEIDDKSFKNESEIDLYKESIYIINTNDANNVLVSYGIINDLNKKEIVYSSNITKNSLIFNLSNNKILGIGGINIKYYNKGLTFKFIINEFINKEEINILIDIQKEEINRDIYFLDNFSEEKLFFNNNHLKELNEINTELCVNNKLCKFKKYFKPEKEGKYNIKLKFNNSLTDCSYMFAGCNNIINIDFTTFSTKNINNMEYMFCGCKFKSINLFSFDTQNVINMNHMFYDCSNLNELDLSSFDTRKVLNMDKMFGNCSNLKCINLSFFDVKNNRNYKDIFYGCNNLKKSIERFIPFRVCFRKSRGELILIISFYLDDKVKDIIEKYRDLSKDYDIEKKFIFNARALPFSTSISAVEAGLYDCCNIFVIKCKGIKA